MKSTWKGLTASHTRNMFPHSPAVLQSDTFVLGVLLCSLTVQLCCKVTHASVVYYFVHSQSCRAAEWHMRPWCTTLFTHSPAVLQSDTCVRGVLLCSLTVQSCCRVRHASVVYYFVHSQSSRAAEWLLQTVHEQWNFRCKPWRSVECYLLEWKLCPSLYSNRQSFPLPDMCVQQAQSSGRHHSDPHAQLHAWLTFITECFSSKDSH